MPLSNFLPVLDNIKSNTNPNNVLLIMSGGEPLLRPDIELCGQEFYKRGFPWGMVTNGMLLSEEKLKALINSGLRALTISLDGLDENHNWLRGNPKSYNNAIRAIEAAVKYPELEFDVVTCVHKRNLNELNLIYTIIKTHKVKSWRIFSIFSRGRAAENPELKLEKEDFQLLLKKIRKFRILGGLKISYGCEGYLGEFEGEVRDHFFHCTTGIDTASVLADGSISGCTSMRDNFIQGNIYNDSFWDCWQNRFTQMRNRSWTKTGPCANCKHYKWCKGNGLHLRHQQSGELLYCHLNNLQ
jgi:radical SAM enzyme (rSAM/lipoprotein system)